MIHFAKVPKLIIIISATVACSPKLLKNSYLIKTNFKKDRNKLYSNEISEFNIKGSTLTTGVYSILTSISAKLRERFSRAELSGWDVKKIENNEYILCQNDIK